MDAGWSLSESTELWNHNLLKIIKVRLIDYLAFKLANRIFLESNAESLYISKKYRIKSKKIRVVYTGCDEKRFNNIAVIPPELNNSNLNNIDFIFRGKMNNEAGFEKIAELFKLFSENTFLIII